MLLKKMTRLVLFGLSVSLCLLLFSACSDDEGGSGYYLKFKANGNLVQYNKPGNLSAAFAVSGDQHNMVIAVLNGSDESFSTLQVYDGKAIEVGTYTDYVLAHTAFVGALMSYNNGTSFTQGVNPAEVTIVISKISSTEVMGTFTATLKASGKSPIEVTEGEFKIPRVN